MAKKKETQETVIQVGSYENKIADTATEDLNVAPETTPATETAPAKKAEKAPFITLKIGHYNKPITEDAKKTRNLAWLAYILFFIPLCIPSIRGSEFARHNVNEGLKINIIDVAAAILLILGAFIPKDIIWIHVLTMIFTFVGVALFVLTTITKIYMIALSAQGKEVSTPWFSTIKFIK